MPTLALSKCQFRAKKTFFFLGHRTTRAVGGGVLMPSSMPRPPHPTNARAAGPPPRGGPGLARRLLPVGQTSECTIKRQADEAYAKDATRPAKGVQATTGGLLSQTLSFVHPPAQWRSDRMQWGVVAGGGVETFCWLGLQGGICWFGATCGHWSHKWRRPVGY